ncbi:MAG TPA: cytochrome c [Lacunisphaera sp.]|nr:cytochrome c [Lacunisphaera sp.]
MKNKLLLTALLSLGAATVSFAADAQANWDEHCAKCHGADGKGDTKMGKKLSIKDFTDAAVQAAFSDDEAVKAMKQGIADKSGKQRMKPIEGLTDDEMKALVPLVRSFKK